MWVAAPPLQRRRTGQGSGRPDPALPVVTTLPARGIIPDSDPKNLGMLGMHGTIAATGAVQRADLLVAIGARFDDRVTGKLDALAPTARVITLTSTRLKSARTVSPTCRSWAMWLPCSTT